MWWIYSKLLVAGLEPLEPWNLDWLSIQLGMACHHPNWRTPSFFRGVGGSTTNQSWLLTIINHIITIILTIINSILTTLLVNIPMLMVPSPFFIAKGRCAARCRGLQPPLCRVPSSGDLKRPTDVFFLTQNGSFLPGLGSSTLVHNFVFLNLFVVSVCKFP